jgi:glyoxylase-like metal-dependent hydrolase (beta-lactamase superfamily II)/ferredoxin
MAHLQHRRPENVEGNFYVDRTCIDCDTCRWMAPEIFHRQGEQSAVHHQPASATERLKALQALLACPTASIGTVEKPADIQSAHHSFPIAIANNVFHCGYHAESSYGAASYLIRRAAGNVLVDSPRFTPPLVKRLEDLGGIRYLYLTHRDDVADHEKFHRHFGCDRLLHKDDLTHHTQAIEIPLSGIEPISIAPDLLVIPVPGHTKGHTVLLHHSFLFSGDHLAADDEGQGLTAFREVCWYSWTEQTRSMQRLLEYDFEWVLPGHGRRYHASASTIKQELMYYIQQM